MTENTITVKQLNLYVKSLLEGDGRLSYISVEGEISDFKNHYGSGHWYFTLKDRDASINCVMFKGSALKASFIPSDGEKVIASGHISLYERDGRYQFYVSDLAKFGEGDLALQFKRVAEKLKKEGLFDESTKRPVTKFPKRIAVVTSKTGAAVHDICKTLESRMPSCEIIMCSATVQGEYAALSMIKTLDRVFLLDGIDTIIIGRGGGSAEDLSCFNDEMLARKIYESPVPVISAVGHEVDTTICDYVADARAATPTAAAVLASEDMGNYLELVRKNRMRLELIMDSIIDKYDYPIRAVASSKVLSNATEYLDRKLQTVDYLTRDITNSISALLSERERKFDNALTRLEGLSPLSILKRGYSVAIGKNGAITSVKDVKEKDVIDVRLFDGTIKCEVKGNE